MSDSRCSLDGCSRTTYARGMCCAHYKRHLKARPRGTARPRNPVAAGDPTTTERISLPEFLAALAAATPSLRGARCRGRVDLFDPDAAPEARAAAITVCSTCPALQPCRTWLDNLEPTQRPLGVTAGQIIEATKAAS